MFVFSDASEYLASKDFNNVGFVLDDFSSSIYNSLHAHEATLFGPTANTELSSCNSPTADPLVLYMSTRPLFCTSMKGFGICFSGYREKGCKKDLKRFLFWIHCMGGRILPDVSTGKPKVTHLVAKNCK